MSNRVLLYIMVITLPLALGAAAWQSTRFVSLQKEITVLEDQQKELVENSNRIIADIGKLSSPTRIEEFAKTNLGLDKKKPEEILQIHIKK
ncbi:MAG: hypothetical protein Ta2F_10340 [Termitinemataceae bacterium]|nr:MAG: hypothetical protein Ta2F_10340 [Termitinemataceae bacterium]